MLRAFLATDYEVWTDGRWHRMRIGSRPTLPTHALRGHGWCIITAFNPNGRIRDPGVNRRASARLRLALARDRRRTLLRSRNRDPAGEWPDEPGWLFGWRRANEVHALAHRFGQRAVVCKTRDNRFDHDNKVELWFYGALCMDNLDPMIRPHIRVLKS